MARRAMCGHGTRVRAIISTELQKSVGCVNGTREEEAEDDGCRCGCGRELECECKLGCGCGCSCKCGCGCGCFLGRSSSAVRSALAWLADDELDDEVDMVV